MELEVGKTYTREELNEALGVSSTCECRIVWYDENGVHHCEEDA